jgi:hypothetical protein
MGPLFEGGQAAFAVKMESVGSNEQHRINADVLDYYRIGRFKQELKIGTVITARDAPSSWSGTLLS